MVYLTSELERWNLTFGSDIPELAPPRRFEHGVAGLPCAD